MTEAQEIALLREEVAGMRQGYATLRPDVDKLLRSLYGESDGESSFYKGFFREFGIYRQETKEEFRSIRDDLRRLRLEVEEVSDVCSGLRNESRAQKARQEKISRWTLPIVVAVIGTALSSILGLVVLILQTYWLSP